MRGVCGRHLGLGSVELGPLRAEAVALPAQHALDLVEALLAPSEGSLACVELELLGPQLGLRLSELVAVGQVDVQVDVQVDRRLLCSWGLLRAGPIGPAVAVARTGACCSGGHEGLQLLATPRMTWGAEPLLMLEAPAALGVEAVLERHALGLELSFLPAPSRIPALRLSTWPTATSHGSELRLVQTQSSKQSETYVRAHRGAFDFIGVRRDCR